MANENETAQSLLSEFSKENLEISKIIMDERESKQIEKSILEFGSEVLRKVLPVGDFILSERTVAERKTRNDFEQSIIDGRMFEQAQRLVESFQRVVVIVEGEKFEERMQKKALLGAIASLITDYGISVFFTKDEEKTAELLVAIANREQLGLKRELRLRGSKRTLTIAQEQQMIIEGLPGVGPQRAKSLLKYFGTIERIVSANEKELAEAPGVGKKGAKMIKRILTIEYREKEEDKTGNEAY